jgi:hypothetical protein
MIIERVVKEGNSVEIERLNGIRVQKLRWNWKFKQHRKVKFEYLNQNQTQQGILNDTMDK